MHRLRGRLRENNVELTATEMLESIQQNISVSRIPGSFWY